MRTAPISGFILAASVGCGKASETAFQSCTEVCTRHHANLDPESCSGYTNDAVDGCIAQCEHYVDVAGEDCSEDVQAFLDDIGGRQLSCVWWEDCSGGYDDTCDGFASTPAIEECMTESAQAPTEAVEDLNSACVGLYEARDAYDERCEGGSSGAEEGYDEWCADTTVAMYDFGCEREWGAYLDCGLDALNPLYTACEDGFDFREQCASEDVALDTCLGGGWL